VVGFEQATIKVQKQKEFDELKDAIERALGMEKVETFLKRLRSSNVRVRDWEAVLANRLLENSDEQLAKSGIPAESLYRSLTLSDQAQMREFYLSRVEEVDPKLRTRFHKIYQYY
jgi:hypothetical protein